MTSDGRRGTRVVFRSVFFLPPVCFMSQARAGWRGNEGGDIGDVQRDEAGKELTGRGFAPLDFHSLTHSSLTLYSLFTHSLLHAPSEQGRTLSGSIADCGESGGSHSSPAGVGIQPIVSALLLSVLNQRRSSHRARAESEKQIYQASCLYEGERESIVHRGHLQLSKSVQAPARRCRNSYGRFR